MKHFCNKTQKQKMHFDNIKSAKVECNKYNSKVQNLGKKKLVAYHCSICNKFHIGSDYEKTITLDVQKAAMSKVNEIIKNTILINRIIIK